MSEFDSAEINLPAAEVARRLEAGEVQVVDVREAYEWEAGRIAGATHIELERLAGRAQELPKDRPLVFQCRLGARSAMAAQAFRASGYEAYSLEGGLKAWVEAGLPLEPEDGTVADH